MKRLLLTLFLLCAHPAFAAVSSPTVSASGADIACAASGFDVPITISSGSNNALFWYVWHDNTTVSITSVKWNGSETLTPIDTQVENPTDNTAIQAFYLANPTATTSNVTVMFTSSAKCFSGGAVFTGVDQSIPMRAGSYTTDQAKSITVTSQTDDVTSTFFMTAVDIAGDDQTIIEQGPVGGSPYPTAFDYAIATGNMTHNWHGSSFDGPPFSSILGFSIQAAGAAPPSTAKSRAQVY